MRVKYSKCQFQYLSKKSFIKKTLLHLQTTCGLNFCHLSGIPEHAGLLQRN